MLYRTAAKNTNSTPSFSLFSVFSVVRCVKNTLCPVGTEGDERDTTSVYRFLAKTASESQRLTRYTGRTRPPLLSRLPFRGLLQGVFTGMPLPLSPTGGSLLRQDPATLPLPRNVSIIAQGQDKVNPFFSSGYSGLSCPDPSISPRHRPQDRNAHKSRWPFGFPPAPIQ